MPDLLVRLEIASETAHRFAVMSPDFAQKVQRRLQRKFKVKVSTQEVDALASHYADLYHFATSALKEVLLPHNDEYASLSHIDSPKFMSQLTTQFPHEDSAILNEIAHWVIQYEYLR